MSPANGQRRRGAPHGNQNRLKHGIYSRHISLDVDEGLLAMPDDRNQDELALARTRLVACLEKQQQASPDDWLLYERAISHYLAAIARLVNHNAVNGRDRKAGVVTILEMIRQINEREHVS